MSPPARCTSHLVSESTAHPASLQDITKPRPVMYRSTSATPALGEWCVGAGESTLATHSSMAVAPFRTAPCSAPPACLPATAPGQTHPA